MALGHCDESDNAVLFRTFVSYDMIQEGQMKDVLASEYLRKVIHGYWFKGSYPHGWLPFYVWCNHVKKTIINIKNSLCTQKLSYCIHKLYL